MSERSLGGLFCDDIREEVGGKKSLIGCYMGVLNASSFPLTFPKLCAYVRLITPTSKPFEKIKFVVLRDDETIAEGEIPKDQLPIGMDKKSDDSGAIQEVVAQFVFSPFVIDTPCVLRVRAQTESGEVRGLGLVIQANESAPIVA